MRRITPQMLSRYAVACRQVVVTIKGSSFITVRRVYSGSEEYTTPYSVTNMKRLVQFVETLPPCVTWRLQ